MFREKVNRYFMENIMLLVALLETASCAVLALIFSKCNTSRNSLFTSFLSGIQTQFYLRYLC